MISTNKWAVVTTDWIPHSHNSEMPKSVALFDTENDALVYADLFSPGEAYRYVILVDQPIVDIDD